MEQHPVPRNISGFQFRLVGDMTLKQFGYLAGGIFIGFLIIKSSPMPAIFNYILGGFFALSGVALAFLPVQERPLDKWLIAFIKSIFSPTQYLWRKEGLLPEVLNQPVIIQITTLSPHHAQAHEDAKIKLKTYLSTLPHTPHQTLNMQEKRYIDNTLSLFSTTPPTAVEIIQPVVQPIPPAPASPIPPVKQSQPVSAPVVQPVPSVSSPLVNEQKIPPPVQNESYIPVSISPPQSQKTPVTPIAPAIDLKTVSVSQSEDKKEGSSQEAIASVQGNEDDTLQDVNLKKMNEELIKIAAEKKSLEKELEMLRAQKTTIAQTVVKPVLEEDKAPTIKTISAKSAVNEMGIPNLSQTPNIIIGVVKDADRKVLPNILITIKDKTSSSLRALKTNKLGQFASSIPIPNGTYFIETEDPLKRFVFDIAEVTLSGKVFLPIEITAKGQKEILREQLNKALFGNQGF